MHGSEGAAAQQCAVATRPWRSNAPGLPDQPQRMVKLQMKIGGCWRSVRTAARYCLIRSYIGTARNHGIHPLDALRDALTSNPWMPPETARSITGLNGYARASVTGIPGGEVLIAP